MKNKSENNWMEKTMPFISCIIYYFVEWTGYFYEETNAMKKRLKIESNTK